MSPRGLVRPTTCPHSDQLHHRHARVSPSRARPLCAKGEARQRRAAAGALPGARRAVRPRAEQRAQRRLAGPGRSGCARAAGRGAAGPAPGLWQQLGRLRAPIWRQRGRHRDRPQSEWAMHSGALRAGGRRADARAAAQGRGWRVYVAPVERRDWLNVGRSLFTRDFWASSCTCDPGYRCAPARPGRARRSAGRARRRCWAAAAGGTWAGSRRPWTRRGASAARSRRAPAGAPAAVPAPMQRSPRRAHASARWTWSATPRAAGWGAPSSATRSALTRPRRRPACRTPACARW